nr:hypothetical protein [Steroidobacter gossypii]
MFSDVARRAGAATDETFAAACMHYGFVNVDDDKLSKSLGNFFRIRDVLMSGC